MQFWCVGHRATSLYALKTCIKIVRPDVKLNNFNENRHLNNGGACTIPNENAHNARISLTHGKGFGYTLVNPVKGNP